MNAEPRLCDFCNAPEPTWVVPARPFTAMGAHSPDDWLACAECARLIQADDWDQLLDRVQDSWQKRYGQPMIPIVAETMRMTYEKLRGHISGPVRHI